MHCKKCNLEVASGDETVCPLCNTPLEKDEQGQEGPLSDALYADKELKELIADIAETVKKSLNKEKKTFKDEEQTSFDLEKALSDEEKPLSLDDVSAAAQRNEYEKKKASLESVLPKYDQSTVVTEHAQRKISIKNIFAVSVVVLVVAGSVIAGYFFAINEPKIVKEKIPIPKTAPLSPDKQVAIPEITVQSPAQPREASGHLQAKTAPAAEAVSPAVPEQKKEKIPAEQKPVEQLPQKSAELPKMATIVTAGLYAVNVGSFKFKESVGSVLRDLKKKGYNPNLETVTLRDNSTWYRITVGQFKTREEAAHFAKELEDKEKIKTMVVKKK